MKSEVHKCGNYLGLKDEIWLCALSMGVNFIGGMFLTQLVSDVSTMSQLPCNMLVNLNIVNNYKPSHYKINVNEITHKESKTKV